MNYQITTNSTNTLNYELEHFINPYFTNSTDSKIIKIINLVLNNYSSILSNINNIELSNYLLSNLRNKIIIDDDDIKYKIKKLIVDFLNTHKNYNEIYEIFLSILNEDILKNKIIYETTINNIAIYCKDLNINYEKIISLLNYHIINSNYIKFSNKFENLIFNISIDEVFNQLNTSSILSNHDIKFNIDMIIFDYISNNYNNYVDIIYNYIRTNYYYSSNYFHIFFTNIKYIPLLLKLYENNYYKRYIQDGLFDLININKYNDNYNNLLLLIYNDNYKSIFNDFISANLAKTIIDIIQPSEIYLNSYNNNPLLFIINNNNYKLKIKLNDNHIIKYDPNIKTIQNKEKYIHHLCCLFDYKKLKFKKSKNRNISTFNLVKKLK